MTASRCWYAFVSDCRTFRYIRTHRLLRPLALHFFSPNTFTFQQLEEALGDGVVMAIAAPPHAGFQIVLLKEHLSLSTGELAALIRMDRDGALRLSSPYRHQ